MITNERQYKISRSEREKFQNALENFDPLAQVKIGIDPIIIEAQKRAIESQIKDLEEDLSRFEALQSGEIVDLETGDLSHIGCQLIEARIAKSLTQKDLAMRLGLKPQQIQRYENEQYKTANLPRLAEVAAALGIETHVRLSLGQQDDRHVSTSSGVSVYPTLPVRSMKKRKWFDGMIVRDDDDIHTDAQLAALYLKRHTPSTQMASLNKQTIRLSGIYDDGALLAWKARILHLASDENPTLDGMQASEPAFTKELAQLSGFDDGPLRAIHLLGEVGVTVVIERHLQRTHLDGAAMLLDRKFPVIGMTLRHDRLDNFWFVLFHELGHVVRHRSTGLAAGFFDDEGVDTEEAIETEADDFARNALISDEIWKSSFVRYSSSKDGIQKFAKRIGIHPAIVAGRIRRERNAFKDKVLNDIVSQRILRSMLSAKAGIPGGYDAS